MNDGRISLELLCAIAAHQDTHLDRTPRLSDPIAEAAMQRAWGPRHFRLWPQLAMLGAAAAVAFVVAVGVVRWNRPALQFQVAGKAGQAGASVTAQAGLELPLRFSDGSQIVFEPGAQARVVRLTDNGAELQLDGGRLVAQVQHTGQAEWAVLAGPYRVRVTGTRFSADWSANDRRLAVRMFEGSVVVEGPELGQGLRLRSGDLLNVRAGQAPVVTREPSVAAAMPSVAVEPAPAPAPNVAPAAENVAPERANVTAPVASAAPWVWAELAAAGRYTEALSAANRAGFAQLCRTLNADGLLLLGDAARYAGSPARARQAFQALVQRYPKDERSPDALFALGRLESEAKSPLAAAKWFERYLGLPGDPPLGEEARGRLVEIYSRSGDEDAASRAARAYLSRYPDGVHAALARKVLVESKAATADAP